MYDWRHPDIDETYKPWKEPVVSVTVQPRFPLAPVPYQIYREFYFKGSKTFVYYEGVWQEIPEVENLLEYPEDVFIPHAQGIITGLSTE